MRWPKLPRPPKRAARKPKPRREQPVEYKLLQTAALCLLAFGVVMVFSASSTTALLGESGDATLYLKKTLIFGAIGVAVMMFLAQRGLDAVRSATPALLAISVVLLLITLVPSPLTPPANGARRWIDLGAFQIQAAELAKFTLILYGAYLIAARPRIVENLQALKPYLATCAFVSFLIVIEPDLGTAMVICFGVGAMLLVAGVKPRHLGLIAAGLGLFALIAIAIEPYRMARLTGFLNPGADPTGAGFQGAQATIALGSGGLWGVGLGESVQKLAYLPEAHTDMIAAVIGEETGLIGLGALMSLYVMLAYAGLRTAQRARDRYGTLLAAGLTAMLTLQAALNLFAVLGLAPLTGVPLPLVSYGNSSLIVSLACVGVLLNIAAGGVAAAPATPAQRRARLRVVDGGRRAPSAARPRPATRSTRSTSASAQRANDRDRRRRDGGARGTRPGGGRRSAR